MSGPGRHASSHGHAPAIATRADLAKVALGALGVVYGDIGTSPLYSLEECFYGAHNLAATRENVFGILSLVFWSLTLVVVVKYLSFIMRADNHGEGGILALLALSDGNNMKPRTKRVLALLALFGAALLYGDGIITPAISVLSAVEGLKVATTAFDRFIVPVTVVIIVSLFLAQKRGTARMGLVFGPATLLWFATISVMGAPWIVRRPEVLASVNPVHAIHFFAHHGWHGFLALGAVVLCITGGEALYADMGHFGRKPIRVAWYVIVFPALLINYFGQGALLLERGEVVKKPFYELVSGNVLYPVVLVATVATVIASQALISGAYSLTQQAIQLGYCPRLTIVHTSGKAEGQIFIPEVNSALMVACVALVVTLQKSTRLAAAYGIAVTGTMAITSVLYFAVLRTKWKVPLRWALPALVGFLAVDLSFFIANATKIADGGWFPIAVAVGLFTLMTTWKRGRFALADFMKSVSLPLDAFIADVERTRPHRVRGTAVFMTSNPEGAPPVLLHHFKHNKILHEQVLLLSIGTSHVPEVPREDRVRISEVGHGFFQVTARYGFMQSPNVHDILDACREAGLSMQDDDTSFYLGRETLLTTGRSKMAGWRKRLFSILSRNAQPATAFFGLPPNRVVEMGTQIEL
ncbi:MAG: potassium transporter Kup [Polyangiaceae bacterium]